MEAISHQRSKRRITTADFLITKFIPDKLPKAKQKYDRGLFRLENAGMAVSAGLGEHTLAFRINNPPELVVIDLYF